MGTEIRFMGRALLIGAISTLTFLSPMIVRAAVIDTVDAANMGILFALGNDPWLSTNASSFGQTFIAPSTDTQLDSLTFYLTPDLSSRISVQASIYQWSGTSTQGAALFTSSSRTLDWTGVNDYGFQALQVATGGLGLVASNQYVAVVTAISDVANAGWGMVWDAAANGGAGGYGDTYAGGQMVVQVTLSSSWIGYQAFMGASDAPDTVDTSFRLDFSAPPTGGHAPEPATALLAFAGLGLVARRRRPV